MLFGIVEGKQGAGPSDDLRELGQLAARVRTGPGVTVTRGMLMVGGDYTMSIIHIAFCLRTVA